MTVDSLLVVMLVLSLLILDDGKRHCFRLVLPLFTLGSDSAFPLNVDSWCVLTLLVLDLSRVFVSTFSLSIH